MTDTALHNALPFEVSTEGVLHFVWNLIVKATRSSVLTREESESLQLIRTGAETYGYPILEATNQQDLKDRFAEVVEDPSFHAHWRRTMTAVMSMGDGVWKSATSQQSSTDSREIFRPVVSGGALLKMEQGFKYLGAYARLMPLVSNHLRTMDSELNEMMSGHLLDIIYDQSVPTEIAEAMYESLCAVVASFALNAALLRGQKLEPWMSLGIVERWSRGLWSDLRLLALTNAGIAEQLPQSVLPLEERFDSDVVNARQAQVQQAFRALNDAAERAGEPVYPAGS